MDKRRSSHNGGHVRAENLSPDVRTAIARDAANKRWSRRNERDVTVKDLEREDMLVMRLHLSSGKFDSTIQVPLFASEQAKRDFVEAWLALMVMGVKAGGSARENKGKTFTNAERLAAALKEVMSDPILFENFNEDKIASLVVAKLTEKKNDD